MISKQLHAQALAQLAALSATLQQIDADVDTDYTHFSNNVANIFEELSECVQVQ